MRVAQILQELPKAEHIVRVSGTAGLVTLIGAVIKGFDAVSLEDGRLIIADLNRSVFRSMNMADIEKHYTDFFHSRKLDDLDGYGEVFWSLSANDLDNITAEQSLLCIVSGHDLRFSIFRRKECLEQGMLGDVFRALPNRTRILIARSLLTNPNENTIEVVTKRNGTSELVGVDKACVSPNVDDDVSYKEVYATDNDGTSYLFRSVGEYQKPE